MLKPLLVAAALLLAGCATVPETPPSLLSPLPQDGRGRIVVRPFYMSSGLNLIAAGLGGGTTPFQASIYDVTGEPRHLGLMTSRGVLPQERRQNGFEYDVEPGQRVLMLHFKYGKDEVVDFIEVPLASGQVEHVALSQYGMMDRPYLVRIPFDQRATRFCGYTPDIRRNAAEKLKEQGLPSDNYSAWYCAALSTGTYLKPAEAPAAWSAPLTRQQVAQMRDQWLPVWRAMPNRTPPYDVIPPAPFVPPAR